MEYIGIICFIVLAVGFALVTKEAMRLKKENQQLHADLETVLQEIPIVSSRDFEEIKQKYLPQEETSCQK